MSNIDEQFLDNHDDDQDRDSYDFLFNSADPQYMWCSEDRLLPEKDSCTFVSGTRHTTLEQVSKFMREPTTGSLTLPATIPLLNTERSAPLSRIPFYGQDFVFQSEQRAAHILAVGPTGAGKNTTVIDPLRFSAIADRGQITISFSLKSSDYGPVKVLCDEVGKKLIVINLNDPWRSIGWNPLATRAGDIAFDRIRRFADAVKNPRSNDSEFWNQWIKTGLIGAWQAGYRSFPALYQLFSLERKELLAELNRHNNDESRKTAEFLATGASNADTAQAGIVSALSASFASENVKRVMSHDELKLDRVFREPVCMHCEMPETSLENQRVLYQMLARSIVDALIDNAELSGNQPIPATLFLDDMPSLGSVMSPERMLTMRSRQIGVVAGVQGLASLSLAYGEATQAMVENFGTKFVLPGIAATDAEYFARSTGEQMVALPTFNGQNSSFITRPLLSSSDIRNPAYGHPMFGPPTTIQMGPITLQAYLQRTYEHPQMASILRRGAAFTGRERLRKRRPSLPRRKTTVAGGSDSQFSNTRGWPTSHTKSRLEEVKDKIGWPSTEGSARKWWVAFEEENTRRISLILRLSEELLVRKATITEFFLAYVYSNTDNIQANLHYLDYVRLKKDEEAKKRKEAASQKKTNSKEQEPCIFMPSSSDQSSDADAIPVFLSSCGPNKSKVAKAIRRFCNLSQDDAKKLVEQAPTIIGYCQSDGDKEQITAEIQKAGGIVKPE